MEEEIVPTGQDPASPRAGWEAAFEVMHSRADDVLLDGDCFGLSSWDDEEWEWD